MNLTLFDLDGTLLRDRFRPCLRRVHGAPGLGRRRATSAAPTMPSMRSTRPSKLDVDAYIAFATSAWRERPAHEQAAAQPALHATR